MRDNTPGFQRNSSGCTTGWESSKDVSIISVVLNVYFCFWLSVTDSGWIGTLFLLKLRVSVLVSGDRFGLDWFGRFPYLALQCRIPVTDSAWIGSVFILKGFGFRWPIRVGLVQFSSYGWRFGLWWPIRVGLVRCRFHTLISSVRFRWPIRVGWIEMTSIAIYRLTLATDSNFAVSDSLLVVSDSHFVVSDSRFVVSDSHFVVSDSWFPIRFAWWPILLTDSDRAHIYLIYLHIIQHMCMHISWIYVHMFLWMQWFLLLHWLRVPGTISLRSIILSSRSWAMTRQSSSNLGCSQMARGGLGSFVFPEAMDGQADERRNDPGQLANMCMRGKYTLITRLANTTSFKWEHQFSEWLLFLFLWYFVHRYLQCILLLVADCKLGLATRDPQWKQIMLIRKQIRPWKSSIW